MKAGKAVNRALFGMMQHMVAPEIEDLVKMNLVGDDVPQIARVLARVVATWWERRGRFAMANCPGCGARGDVAHVAACAGARLADARREGAAQLLEMAHRQIERRGTVEVSRLAAVVLHGRWRR